MSCLVGVEGPSVVLFAELLTLRTHGNGQVHVARRLVAEQALQVDLGRGAGEEVLSANDFGNACRGVIYDGT